MNGLIASSTRDAESDARILIGEGTIGRERAGASVGGADAQNRARGALPAGAGGVAQARRQRRARRLARAALEGGAQGTTGRVARPGRARLSGRAGAITYATGPAVTQVAHASHEL